MDYSEKKKEIIKLCFEKDILVNPDFLNQLQEEELEKIQRFIAENEDINFLDKNIFENQNNEKQINKSNVKVLFNYQEESKKRTEQDFIAYFNSRYKALEQILKQRFELQDAISINRALAKTEKETISLIGLVEEKQITKNGHIFITLEDPTGKIRVLVNKDRKDLFQQAKDIVEDEAIGIKGTSGNKIVFADNILQPDIPLNKTLKKSKQEGYAVFISDLHFGAKNFLRDKFEQFIKWINGEVGGEEHKQIAKKIKYLFIVGDVVEGAGIYPGQEKDVFIEDIYEQYEECAKILSKIPSHISIIICPGNHDAMRIAEPQPPLYKDFAKPLYELKNTVMVSNPALLNIDSTPDFEGFDILLYHGFSFPYYADIVESIRNEGGMERSDLIMKFLLQRRHLAPSHSSTLTIPDANKDPLVIDTIPDFFVTGHIHTLGFAEYKNISMINVSCWMTQTDDQIRRGIVPKPARAVMVNLKTRRTKILKF